MVSDRVKIPCCPKYFPQNIRRRIISIITAIVFAIGTPLLTAAEYQLSTHVLDTTSGTPGAGVEVLLEKYFEAKGVTPVFPEAVVVFKITNQAHYHIPVVVTPFAISTYRGS